MYSYCDEIECHQASATVGLENLTSDFEWLGMHPPAPRLTAGAFSSRGAAILVLIGRYFRQ